MAFYVDEEDLWKCPSHPSKRRRIGVCPVCLRDRLATLCPDCAHVRPCGCCATATIPSSSPSSTSFSSSLHSEPSFWRSRSLAIPFLRSRSRFVGDRNPDQSSCRTYFAAVNDSDAPSFWSTLKLRKSRRSTEAAASEREDEGDLRKKTEEAEDEILRRKTMMMKSRSVTVTKSESRFSPPPTKERRRWHFPSPISIFRRRRIAKVVHERSPLHRESQRSFYMNYMA